jgi:hypothetical protein
MKVSPSCERNKNDKGCFVHRVVMSSLRSVWSDKDHFVFMASNGHRNGPVCFLFKDQTVIAPKKDDVGNVQELRTCVFGSSFPTFASN